MLSWLPQRAGQLVVSREKGNDMAKGKYAQTAWGAGFDSAWMARINAETARIARSFGLSEESVRAVAQDVAITLWQNRSPDQVVRVLELPGPRTPGPYP
jgi:hypothetical protein